MPRSCPDDPLFLRRASQLRVLRSPVRSQLLRVLRRLGPATVAFLGEALGRSPESLHYHVRALLKAGYVERAGESAGPGRSASLYRVASRKLLLDPRQRSPAFLAAVGELYAAALRRAERDVVAGVAADRRVPGDRTRRTGLLQLDLRLTAEGRARLREAMEAWFDELEALDDPEGEVVSVTTVYAPSLPPSEREV